MATGGAKTTPQMRQWEKDVASKMRSDNNPAERPFAIMKDILQRCPTMTLANLGRLAHVKTNGTYTLPASKPKTKKTVGRD